MNNMAVCAELSSHPGYFWESHWLSIGLPEMFIITWQLCLWRACNFVWECLWRSVFNTLSPRENGRHFSDDILSCIFMNENILISKDLSLKYVPWGLIANRYALVQIMALQATNNYLNQCWHSSPPHICVTRPQWVNNQQNGCHFANNIFKCMFLPFMLTMQN